MFAGDRLKEARVRNKKSLQQLADAVGASKAHVWELETGRAKNPSMELVDAIAKALGVSVSFLVDENPPADGDPPDVVRMYRDLKGMTEEDRSLIQTVIDRFKATKESS